MRADVHMHTSFSHDSKSAPEEMIQKSIEKGLEVICFTDHYDKDYLGWGEESVFDVEKYFNARADENASGAPVRPAARGAAGAHIAELIHTMLERKASGIDLR